MWALNWEIFSWFLGPPKLRSGACEQRTIKMSQRVAAAGGLWKFDEYLCQFNIKKTFIPFSQRLTCRHCFIKD